MQSSQWLKGGPFLEVSFLVELKENKKQTIQGIIDRLSTLANRVEIIDVNIDEKIDEFERGYPYDEEDPESIILHFLELKLFVYLSGKRRALLQIELVSSNSLMVNFIFYGDEEDAPEWDQLGIKNEEYTGLTDFLKELYGIYNFKIGGIAMEENIISLFGCEKPYPSNCYRYENMTADYFLKEETPFARIIWNEKYKKLSDIPYKHHRFEKEGILIELCDFDVW